MGGAVTASDLARKYIKPEMMSRKQPLSCPQHACLNYSILSCIHNVWHARYCKHIDSIINFIHQLNLFALICSIVCITYFFYSMS